MQHFIYIESDEYAARGFNRALEVYRIMPAGRLKLIGSNYHLDSATWKGYRPNACKIISDELGHKMDLQGYNLVAKHISVRNARNCDY